MKKGLLLVGALLYTIVSSTVNAAPVVIKLAHGGSTTHQYHIGAEEFKRLVEERSNKEILVNVFPQGQLAGERDAIEGVRMGTIQMGIVAAEGPLPSFVPEMGVLITPYVLQSRKQAYAVLDGPFGEELNALIAKKRLKNLCFWEVGFRHFTTAKTPINTPEDLKNLKIRVQGSKVWLDFIDSLGAVPTPIAFGELYSALQQGLTDGQENPIATIFSMRYYEVQKNLILDGHTYSAAAVLMNPKFFDGLSKEHQELILQAARDTRDFQRKKLEELDTERLAFLEKEGVAIVKNPDIAAFAAATKDFDKRMDTVPAEMIVKFKKAAAEAK